MLFGADAEENSEIVSKFRKKLICDVKYLESQVFKITVSGKTYNTEFKLGELPNDMKMLSFVAGELTNSATYFSTFANVTQIDVMIHKKGFGKNSESEWSPFPYEKRLADAAKVANKKEELEKSKLAKSSKRTKLTSYIAKELKSRQEFIPLVERYIDCAKAEPLHLKNNVIKERFIFLFKICLAESKFENIKKFIDVPQNSLFFKLVNFTHYIMGCNSLATKIKTWFNENSGKTEKYFSFRFRGKESFL